jgi:hypothetical protein
MYSKGYEKVKGNIIPYLHLFDLMNSLGLTPEELQELVRYGYELPQLQSIHKKLENRVQTLSSNYWDLDSQLQKMSKEVQQYKDSLQFYDSECVQKISQLRRLSFKIRKMNRIIHRPNNDEGYKRAKELAKKEVELVIQDNRAVTSLVVSATVEALRRYGAGAVQQLLIDLFSLPTASPYGESPIESHKSQLIELSEHIQIEMKQQITNDAINNFQYKYSTSEVLT